MAALPECCGLCNPKGLDGLRKFDGVFELVIVAHQAIENPPAGLNDQAGYADKGVQKAFKLHAYNGQAQGTIG